MNLDCIFPFFFIRKHWSTTENFVQDVVLAEYNLDLGKWVCPVAPTQKKSQSSLAAKFEAYNSY